MKNKHLKITEILALLTLTVFALCILLVLLMGATVYQNLVDQSAASHARRTALGYLSTRVRQAEAVAISDFQGCDALVLEETVANETYTTRIYCWDGWLRELYAAEDADLAPKDGEPLLEASMLSCTQDKNLLTLSLGQDKLLLYLPEKPEVSP